MKSVPVSEFRNRGRTSWTSALKLRAVPPKFDVTLSYQLNENIAAVLEILTSLFVVR